MKIWTSFQPKKKHFRTLDSGLNNSWLKKQQQDMYDTHDNILTNIYFHAWKKDYIEKVCIYICMYTRGLRSFHSPAMSQSIPLMLRARWHFALSVYFQILENSSSAHACVIWYCQSIWQVHTLTLAWTKTIFNILGMYKYLLCFYHKGCVTILSSINANRWCMLSYCRKLLILGGIHSVARNEDTTKH